MKQHDTFHQLPPRPPRPRPPLTRDVGARGLLLLPLHQPEAGLPQFPAGAARGPRLRSHGHLHQDGPAECTSLVQSRALQVPECLGPVTSDFRGTDEGRRAGGKAIKSYFCVSHPSSTSMSFGHKRALVARSRVPSTSNRRTAAAGSLCKVHASRYRPRDFIVLKEIGMIQKANGNVKAY